MRLLIRLAINAAALWAATRIVSGITFDGEPAFLLVVALIFGILNALVRPIMMILTLPLIIITVTLSFSGIVLAETILSYLGVGLKADQPSWGNMIDGARDELTRDPIIWWNFAAATGALFLLVLALNLFADALRDAIDPRLRSS